jgi:hypothetical protein
MALKVSSRLVSLGSFTVIYDGRGVKKSERCVFVY